MRVFNFKILLVFLSFVCLAYLPLSAFAGWNQDYVGTIGDKDIGLTITKQNITNIHTPIGDNIIAAHYFYHDDLVDINLKQKSHDNRDIELDELNEQGNVNGTFHLTYAKEDPKQHFRDKNDLREEVLTGFWIGKDGKTKFPVYLSMESETSGDADGGRCGLTGEQYQRLQMRVVRFHKLVLDNDFLRLKKEFHYVPVITKQFLADFSKTVPHDLFCNWQGFMLGSGIVWFDEEGNVIVKK